MSGRRRRGCRHTGFGRSGDRSRVGDFMHAGGWHESNGRSYQTVLGAGRCGDGCRQREGIGGDRGGAGVAAVCGQSSDGRFRANGRGQCARGFVRERCVRGDVYGPKRCGVCRARERILDGAWQSRDFAARRRARYDRRPHQSPAACAGKRTGQRCARTTARR